MISFDKFKAILNNAEMSDADVLILFEKAKREALNYHYWRMGDYPTAEEQQFFFDKYEFEIYDVGRAIDAGTGRDGQIQHTELGITRVWESTGQEVRTALSAIPRKVYVEG